MFVEFAETRYTTNYVCRFVNHDNRRRAQTRLHLSQRIKVHQHSLADTVTEIVHMCFLANKTTSQVETVTHIAEE